MSANWRGDHGNHGFPNVFILFTTLIFWGQTVKQSHAYGAIVH